MKRILYTLIFIALLNSCEVDSDSDSFIKTGEYLGAYWPTTSWQMCKPSEVGMNSSMLNDLDELVEEKIQEGFDMHSILIIRKGYIVAEKYYNKYFDEQIEHNVYSCTKSITSACVGIAIEKGLIPGVDQKVLPLFNDYIFENTSAFKDEITIEHFLTMSAGIEWHEMDYAYGDARNTYTSFNSSSDKIKFVLDQPMQYSPGAIQNYNTGLSHVLSAIVQRSSQTRLDTFAMNYLFEPIGIDGFSWTTDGNGIIQGGSELRLTPRNMARFGYLMLNEGNWDGTQLISSEWVLNSQQWHFDFQYIADFGYGYQYWIAPFGAFCAVGYRGQWIMIFPEHDMVVVFTNNFNPNSQEEWNFPEYLIRNYILPSIIN